MRVDKNREQIHNKKSNGDVCWQKQSMVKVWDLEVGGSASLVWEVLSDEVLFPKRLKWSVRKPCTNVVKKMAGVKVLRQTRTGPVARAEWSPAGVAEDEP